MREKVIIIGGGFGGIAAAKRLSNSQFDVLLIDKVNHHLFQPLLYQVASAALSPGDIATPIREVLSHAKNISVIQANVKRIDKHNKYIEVESGDIYKFDQLIVGIGVKPDYYNHSEWKRLAPGLKTLDDALIIRNQVLNSFERAEKTKDQNLKKRLLTFVVVGGGPTGIELAGAFAEIAKKTLINDFRNIKSSDAKIYLIEGGPRVLGSYSESLSVKAEGYLCDLGVQVLNGENVSQISNEAIVVGNQTIDSLNIVWAAGNKAPELLKSLDTDLDRMGRVVTTNNLSIKNSNNIYVIGDSANFKNENGDALPGLAPVASQQGRYVAKRILGLTSKKFKYFDKGSMATIGRFKAVMEFKGIKLGGFIAWLSWCFIHILFLIDFRNKMIVFIQWAMAFFFFKRGVRIITNTNLESKDK
jgi:NADH dehydrogenase